MKIRSQFKYSLYVSVLFLYLTGVLYWVLDQWFKVDRGLGLEASPFAALSLHSHSILGLWFLILFGYLFHSHILPGLKRKQKLRSGWCILSVCLVLILTVPGLFYLSDDSSHHVVSVIHIYIGLLSLFVFVFHIFRKISQKK